MVVGERHFSEEHDFTLRKPKEQRGYFSFGGISGEQHFGREGQSSDLQASRGGGHLCAASDLHVLIMLSAELFFFSTVYIPDGLGGMKTPPPFSIHMGAVEITWDLHWKVKAMV